MSPEPTTRAVRSVAAGAQKADAVLDVREVSVHFGGVRALDSVSLSVRAGAVTGLIGPNGAGKTTLFNVLSGLQRPDRGKVLLGGRDVSRLGPHQRAQLGLARTFQRLELFWSLSVAENVQVGAESAERWWRVGPLASGSRGRRDVPDATGAATGRPAAQATASTPSVAELLERVGLAHVAGQPVDALPTGQARLVELARALAIGPRILLLDEPGSGLDDTESAALGDLLVGLAGEGMAVLLVEHDMDLLMRVCRQVFVFDYGQLIAAGTPEEIRDDVAVQTAYLGAQPLLSEGAAPASVANGQVPTSNPNGEAPQ